jgi:hypothetical protein
MATQEETSRVVTDAERLIDAREFPEALWRLRIAVGNVQADDPNAAWLYARIRDAAAAIAWTDPRYEGEAQAVWDTVGKREAGIGEDSRASAPMPTRRPSVGGWWEAEPQLRAAETVADLAIVASILSVIFGILAGVRISRYTTFDGTRHHGWVIVFWIAVGLFVALAWVGLAVGLNVLAYIGRSQRTAPASP